MTVDVMKISVLENHNVLLARTPRQEAKVSKMLAFFGKPALRPTARTMPLCGSTFLSHRKGLNEQLECLCLVHGATKQADRTTVLMPVRNALMTRLERR